MFTLYVLADFRPLPPETDHSPSVAYRGGFGGGFKPPPPIPKTSLGTPLQSLCHYSTSIAVKSLAFSQQTISRRMRVDECLPVIKKGPELAWDVAFLCVSSVITWQVGVLWSHVKHTLKVTMQNDRDFMEVIHL
jgi:hypothetical protein